MNRRRIIIEYNKETHQYEWEIQEYIVISIDSMGWRDIQDFAGQNEFFNEAAEEAYQMLGIPKGL